MNRRATSSEYWRERDKAEAEAYREWLKARAGQDREFRKAYDLDREIGRVIVGEAMRDD